MFLTKQWFSAFGLIVLMAASASAQHFNPVTPTGIPYAILVYEATAGGEFLAAGDEVGVFDGDLCVGSATMEEDWPLPLIAWGEDPAHGLQGFNVGNPMVFRIWVASSEWEYPTLATYIEGEGDGNFGTGPFSGVVLVALTEQVRGSRASLQNFRILATYPNPFNSTLTVTFESAKAGRVRFKVYSLTGKIIFQESLDVSVGVHRYSVNLEKQSGPLPSGTYFLSLETPRNVTLRKVILLK